jgi:hypothetical protein
MGTTHPATAIIIVVTMTGIAAFVLFHLFRFLRRSLEHLFANRSAP